MLLIDAFPKKFRSACAGVHHHWHIDTVEQAQNFTDEELLRCRMVGKMFIQALRNIEVEPFKVSDEHLLVNMKTHESRLFRVTPVGDYDKNNPNYPFVFQVVRVIGGWQYINANPGGEQMTFFVPEPIKR